MLIDTHTASALEFTEQRWSYRDVLSSITAVSVFIHTVHSLILDPNVRHLALTFLIQALRHLYFHSHSIPAGLFEILPAPIWQHLKPSNGVPLRQFR
jgi:hypothetical protein